ncbi:hypothetical protein D3C71_1365610 [compost metagenome]
MADHDDGDAGLLGQARQLRRAFAHLRHRPWRGAEFAAVEGLDRVDDGNGGLLLRHRGLDGFQPDFRQQIDIARLQAQPARAQRHLLGGFLAGHIQHVGGFGKRGQRLQQQRRLADAGITADEHHRAGDQAAAQHTVELFESGGLARRFAGLDLGQAAHGAGGGQGRIAVGRRGGRRRFHRFFQGVPGVAMRAFALPLRGSAAAVGAHVYGSGFGHARKCTGNPARRRGAAAAARVFQPALNPVRTASARPAVILLSQKGTARSYMMQTQEISCRIFSNRA